VIGAAYTRSRESSNPQAGRIRARLLARAFPMAGITLNQPKKTSAAEKILAFSSQTGCKSFQIENVSVKFISALKKIAICFQIVK
jgi:hypothetical protein